MYLRLTLEDSLSRPESAAFTKRSLLMDGKSRGCVLSFRFASGVWHLLLGMEGGRQREGEREGGRERGESESDGVA